MTWLEILNRYFLQFFFVRLFRIVEYEDVELREVSLAKEGIGTAFTPKKINQKFKLGGWIEPFSGYGNDFKWHGRVLFGKKLK